jgi:hypothetical protein
MNRPLLPALAIFVLIFSDSAQAQTQSSESFDSNADDEAYEYAYDLLSSMSLINENCKGALEPTYYEGFKVLLRVNYGAMGATDEHLQKQDASTIEFADYLCADKAACWRSATGLPATATLEEGRAKCMDMLMAGMQEFDDLLGANAEPAT